MLTEKTHPTFLRGQFWMASMPQPKVDIATRRARLDKLVDRVFWAACLSFSVLVFLSLEGRGVWERLAATALAFFVSLLGFGIVSVIVRRFIIY